MAFVTLALLGVAIALIINYFHNTYNYWQRRGVPYETPLPILGNMKGVGTTVHFRDIYQRYYKKFKGQTPFAGMFMFVKKVAFVIDLDLVKQVLIKDFKRFQDRGVFHNVRDEPLTRHLFSLDGEEWRSLRHKLTPVFTSGKMKHMFSTVLDVSKHLTTTMGKYVEAAAADGGDVEVKELCARYTTDVIGSVAFGLECNSLADPKAEFRSKGRAIFERSRYPKAVSAFIFTNAKLARRMRFKALPDDITSFFMNAVKSTVDYRMKNGVKRNDFLDQLIQMKAENEEEARKGNGIDLSKGLTIEQMAAQAFVFFIAGFETSSSTMAFCLYELALEQKVQSRLRNEIETVLKEVSDGEVTYDAINQMPYLDQVLAETLRKRSIVSHLMRQAGEDYQVPGTKLVIEKGTTLLIPINSIHHDPEIYPNPDCFDPTRFEPEAIKARHPYAYLPFGDGPRNCIGERFGKMQSKIGLISLLRYYKFSVSHRTDIPLVLDKSSLPLSTKNGIHLKVERI